MYPANFTALSDFQPSDHLDIGLVGDVVPTDEMVEQCMAGAAWSSGALWGPFSGCAVILANLEGAITARTAVRESKPYNLRISPRAAELFDARFVLNLANNHTMDYGSEGLLDTIGVLDAAGLRHVGAGIDLEHARAPCYVSVCGLTVAVIGAADERFQSATETSPGTCPAVPELLTESLRAARERAKVLAVSLHMGLEYVHMPSARQLHLARACLAAGAHLVHFHHSHRLSGCAVDGRGAVLFGTGNFLFPPVTPIVPAASRRTAYWRTRYSRREDTIAGVAVEPARLDRAGIPCRVEPRRAVRETAAIDRYGRRALAPSARFWRLQEMLRPAFIFFVIYNYCALLTRRGPLFVWRSLVAGVKAHRTT